MEPTGHDSASSPTPQMHKILVVGMSSTQSHEILRFVRRALDDTDWEIIYLALEDSSRHDLEAAETLAREAHNLEILDWRTSSIPGAQHLRGFGIVSIFRRITKDYAEAERVKNLVANRKINLVVVCQDGLGGPLRLIAEANRAGVPSIIIPFAYEPKGATYKSLLGGPSMKRVHSRLDHVVALAFPRWVDNFESERYFRLPILEILYRELVGLSVPNPWTVNGGRATIALVDSLSMSRNYREGGVTGEKIRTVGALMHDELFTLQLRTQGSTEPYGEAKNPSRFLNVFVALPASFFPSRQEHSEFKTYRDLICNWASAIASNPSVQVVWQAHPQTAAEDAATIEEIVSLSRKSVFELIAECDVLITTDSSIIKAAIVLRKPVINYDAYGWDAPLFMEVRPLIRVSTLEDLQARVRDLENPRFYGKVVSELDSVASDWGQIDGKAWSRIRGEIETLFDSD